MPTPPTLITYAESSWSVNTTPKTVNVSWQTGDIIVVLSGNEGGATMGLPTVTGLTFATQQVHDGDGTTCGALISTAVAGSASSGNISISGDGIKVYGFAVWVWRSSAGVGNSSVTFTTGLTTALTETGADGAICYGTFDFSAAAVLTITPAPTHTRQRAVIGTNYTIYVSDLTDQPSTGSIGYGLTSGSGVITNIAIEIKASASTASPVVTSDFPNPRLKPDNPELRTFLDRTKLNLSGKDKFFGAAGQGPKYDYPNPAGKPYPLDSKTHIDPVKLNLLGKDKFFGAPGMGPVYDYPNPRGKPFPIDGLTFVDPMEHWLLKDQFFGAPGQGPNYDWPNPTKSKPCSIDNITFFDSVNQLLASQDKFFAAPGMGPAYDWPNPRGPIHITELKTHYVNLLRSTLGVAASPFTYTDWPNPRGAAFPIENRTFLDGTYTQLIGKDKFFNAPGQGPNYDWPNPLIARQPDRTNWIQSLLSTTLAVPFNSWIWTLPARPQQPLASITHLGVASQLQDQFFGVAGQPPANLDWPNPRGYVGNISLRTLLDPLKINLYGQDTFFAGAGQPPSTVDWINPRGAVVPRFGIYESLRVNLLATAQPFYLTEWPNPRIANWPVDLRTFLDGVDIQLIGQDTFFGAPGQPLIHEWVNPRGAIPGIDLRSWSNDLIRTTLAIIIPYPFSLTEWPNPRGAAFPIEDRTYIDPMEHWLFGKDQFFGPAGMAPTYDWPNPRGAQFPSDLRTFIDTLKQNLAGKDKFFGAAGMGPGYDWPNPLIKPHPLDVRTWLNDLIRNTLAPVPYPFSLIDWPNPLIAGPLNRGFINQVSLELFGKDKLFGGPGQPLTYQPPPNPPGARRAIELLTWLINLQELTLSPFVQPPFTVTNWPNPIPYRQPTLYHNWSIIRPLAGPSVYTYNQSKRMIVARSERTMQVAASSRKMLVAASSRVMSIPSVSRKMLVPRNVRTELP